MMLFVELELQFSTKVRIILYCLVTSYLQVQNSHVNLKHTCLHIFYLLYVNCELCLLKCLYTQTYSNVIQ